jgi:hypothetical protein
MEIFVFLIGLGCLVLIVWAIALFGSLVLVETVGDKTDCMGAYCLYIQNCHRAKHLNVLPLQHQFQRVRWSH